MHKRYRLRLLPGLLEHPSEEAQTDKKHKKQDEDTKGNGGTMQGPIKEEAAMRNGW